MNERHAAHDRKPEAKTARMAIAARVQPVKRFEDTHTIRSRNARTIVLNRQHQRTTGAC